MYNTDKKISDVYNSDIINKQKIVNIAVSQTAQYMAYLTNNKNLYVSHNYGQTFTDTKLRFKIENLNNIHITEDGSKIKL